MIELHVHLDGSIRESALTKFLGYTPKEIYFYKVDVDKQKELSDRLNFEGVPTLFLFHNGRYSEVPYPYDDPDDLTGYRKDDIIDFIHKRVGI